MFFKYPYTNLYNLNLDWIIQAIKEMQTIVEPLERVVNSVNGMTGDVEITKALLTQILGGLVETFNGRSGAVELTAEDVNATLIDITWTSDPGETINNLSQSELDEMYISGKRVLIFVNNQSVADRVYFLQYYNNHAQPQEYTPTSALAGVISFNGQTGNVTVTGADLQTSATDTRTIADNLAALDVSKVPATRTVNGKYLSANITLNDEDIPSTVDGQTTVEGVLTAQSQKITALGPVNNVSSDSTTAALAAAQGKVLNQRVAALGPVNNVTSDSTTAALAAAQGKALSQRMDGLTPKPNYSNSQIVTVVQYTGNMQYTINTAGYYFLQNQTLAQESVQDIRILVNDILVSAARTNSDASYQKTTACLYLNANDIVKFVYTGAVQCDGTITRIY